MTGFFLVLKRLPQITMFEMTSEGARNLMAMFAENKRSPRVMTEKLNAVLDQVEQYGNPNQMMMPGIERPTADQMIAQGLGREFGEISAANIKYHVRERVQEALDGKLPSDELIEMRNAPEVLIKIGMPNSPLFMAQGHAKNAIINPKDADHAMSLPEMAEIVAALDKPVALIRSKSNDDTVVAIVDYKINEKQVVAPVAINRILKSGTGKVNILLSLYGRGNAISGLMENAIVNENNGIVSIYYLDQEKLQRVAAEQGHQLPKLNSNATGFIHNITEVMGDVKQNVENGLDNSETIKRDLRGGDMQSKREMLLSALEQQDISDRDRKTLQEYKLHLNTLKSQETELAAWKREQGDLMKKQRSGEQMSQGERVRLLNLNEMIKDRENRISKLDKRLLDIEQMQPIKRAYNRQVKTEYEKARQMANERVANYRDWRRESDRGKRARNTIESAAKWLNKALQAPTNQTSVPEGMRAELSAIVSAIDMGNTQYEQKVLKGQGISKKAQGWRESMARLASKMAQYDTVANFDGENATGHGIVFDPDLRTDIGEFLDKSRGVLRYRDMDVAQQEQLAKILTEVKRAVSNANKMITENRAMDAPALDFIQESEAKRAYKLKQGALGMVEKIAQTEFADSFTFADSLGETGKKMLGLLQHDGFGKFVEII